jgi:shikimate kinase
MMEALKVVLVGLPGSGKSTFGKVLAKELRVDFLDLDRLIEQQSGKTIPMIFSEKGEGTFRELESKELERVLSNKESFVLASGGGCPCFNDNMDLINQKGISVYLDVPLNEISSRLQHSKVSNRPMFEGLDAGEITLKLKNLLAQRGRFYDQAKIKLSGNDFSAEFLIMELISILKGQSDS